MATLLFSMRSFSISGILYVIANNLIYISLEKCLSRDTTELQRAYYIVSDHSLIVILNNNQKVIFPR